MSLLQITKIELKAMLEEAATAGAMKALASVRKPGDRWISIEEAKVMLKVKSYSTLYRLVSEGKIVDNGKSHSQRRFSQKSVDKYLGFK
jgi:peptidyl-tRNA hydrolase